MVKTVIKKMKMAWRMLLGFVERLRLRLSADIATLDAGLACSDELALEGLP